MADKKYYAWSRFPKGQDEWGRYTGFVMPGEEVTAKSLDCSAESFQQLVEVGAVRSTPYPVPEGVMASPAEHLLNEAARIASADYSDEDAQNALLDYTSAAAPAATPVVDPATVEADKAAAKD